MKDTPNKQTGFLTYDMVGFEGFPAGPTDMYYERKNGKLVISEKFRDHRSSLEIVDDGRDIKVQLTEFLEEFFANPMGFIGTPTYGIYDTFMHHDKKIVGTMFTKEEFDIIMEKAIKKINERQARAEESELVSLCREYGLSPEPTGADTTSFWANCITGRPHRMQVSTLSEEWGCGYCRIKGGINELKEAYKKYRGSGK